MRDRETTPELLAPAGDREAMRAAVANGADAVGPFYLGRWEANGRSGWQLTNAPTTPVEIPALSSTAHSTPAPAAPSVAPTTDDDIPF